LSAVAKHYGVSQTFIKSFAAKSAVFVIMSMALMESG